jgi:hypothetical protein
LIPSESDLLHQVIPQSSLFLCSLIYWKHIDLNGKSINGLIEQLDSNFDIQIDALTDIVGFSRDFPKKISKAWPWLLKSQEFFDDVKLYLNETYQIVQ